MVTDFSAGALPTAVKFSMAVWPHFGQVFSYFGGFPQGWPSFGRQQGPYGGICFLLKLLFASFLAKIQDRVTNNCSLAQNYQIYNVYLFTVAESSDVKMSQWSLEHHCDLLNADM